MPLVGEQKDERLPGRAQARFRKVQRVASHRLDAKKPVDPMLPSVRTACRTSSAHDSGRIGRQIWLRLNDR